MKKFATSLFFMANLFFCYAQMTSSFYYESAIYTPDGFAVPLANIQVKAELRQSNSSGTLLYAETHSLKTRHDGTFALVVGKGEPIFGDLDTLDWAQNKIWMLIYLNRYDGNGFVKVQESELLPVPYALYAGSVKNYWQKNGQNLYYNQGNIGIKTSNPTEALELGVNNAIRLSTTKTWLSESGLVKLMWADQDAKPAIGWYNQEKKPIAALYAYQNGQAGEIDSCFSIGTSTSTGKIVPRLNIPWGHDRVTISTQNANFKISEGYKFIVGSDKSFAKTYFYGDVFIKNGKRLGIGDKDWENYGFTGDAALEIYKPYSNASLLINQPTGQFAAQLTLQSGDSRWDITADDHLAFSHNTKEQFCISANGNVGIGVVDPQEKLEVDGNIRIPAGYSFISGNKGMASYFETETSIEPGTLVGLDPATGKIRPYCAGDEFIGISTLQAAYISNAPPEQSGQTQTLVCYKGQVSCNRKSITVEQGKVFTPDGNKIGVLLANGDVFIK